MTQKPTYTTRKGTGNDELDAALIEDKMTTAYWYQRISGQVRCSTTVTVVCRTSAAVA